jgi:multiple sugar transport system ATP-binding protein
MAQVVLKDVVKNYGPVYAVNRVSLTVEDGEFVALVGPSGCGKTTTLNLVAGLIPMSGGRRNTPASWPARRPKGAPPRRWSRPTSSAA